MRRKSVPRSAVIVLGLLVAISLAANADSIIFNDLGPGHTYNPSTGFAIAGVQSTPGFIEWGEAFTPNGRFDLTQITLGLSWFSGMNGVTVSLDANNGGAPGKSLATWLFVGLPAIGTSNSIVQTMTFSSSLVLQPGQTYWLVVAATGGNTQLVWNANSTGVSGLAAVNFGNGWLNTQATSGAFEVLGKAIVPEPATWLLFGTGIIGSLIATRRKTHL
jgi:PEP-CTERM motif